MTKSEMIVKALRRLGVVAQDEPATADQIAHCGAILDDLVAETGLYAPVPWSIDDVPPGVAGPLWRLLAVEVAPDYSVDAPEPYKTALIRFQAAIAPDNRPQTEESAWF